MERILQKRYRIVRSVGRGGLGAVFLCDDLRLPGKQWALKQMHSPEEGMYDKFRETFDREALTLSRLRHPNLPVIVDYFEENAECYLVMEYVEGENLAEHVRRCGTLTEKEAFERGLVLSRLLVYLHGQKPPVIFRDMKPENIMLTTEAALKLVDFGLARRFVPGKRSDTLPSGSVGYAAPEQWEDLSQTDERSDVYSWGATLVYLLTGKIPSPVFPLSALRTLQPPLTEEGEELLVRCLKGRPSERFPNAEALERAVEVHLATLAIRAERMRVGVAAAAAAPSPVQRAEPVPEMRRKPAPTPEGRRFPGDVQPIAVPSNGHAPLVAKAPPTRPLPLRAMAGPLALLLAATLVFVIALLGQIPRRPTADPSIAPSGSARPPGVGPYRLHYASNPKKDEGRKLYEEGHYNQAVELLDEATTQFPDDAEAHVLKENAYILLTGAPHVTIPYIGTQTGVDSPDAFSQLHGLALAQATVNARGGIHGKKVLVALYDDESSTSRCLQIAQQVVQDPKVLVAIGAYNTQRTAAIAPIFNNAHLPIVSPAASGMKAWDSGPYIFSAADSTDRRVRALARHVVRGGFKRVGVVLDEASHLSFEMKKTFESEVAHGGPGGAPLTRGLQIVELPGFEEDVMDFTPQIAAIQKLKPDILFFCDYRGATTAEFAIQLRAHGVRLPIFSQTIPFTRDLVSVGKGAVEGLILSSFFHPQMETPRMRAFMAAFRRKFGDLTPTHLTVGTFDALTAVCEALETCTTREQVRDRLRASGVTRPPYPGIAGPFALGRRLDARPVWIIEVSGGLYRLVDNAAEDAAHR